MAGKDRVREIITNHIKHLEAMIGLMEAGRFSTRTDGKDSTAQTIEDYRVNLASLYSSLQKLDEA